MKALLALGRAVVPQRHRRSAGMTLARVMNFGFSRYCPCCRSWVRKFLPHGLIPRSQARCPVCRSLERHRLIYLYLKQRTDFFDGRPKKMLHVAPELGLTRHFQNAPGIDYLSADLMSPRAMVKMDITEIQYPDATFDVIYCSHVLEHVPDDRKAMREFFRVLKPGGWAILQVPISADATFEDPSITDPKERERLFGQHDHVRCYGPDYADRLTDAGFVVTTDEFARQLGQDAIRRFGLMESESIYFCRRPATVN